MKKILLSLLGIITLGLISFSSAGFETILTGNMTTLYRNDYISTNPNKFAVSSSDYGNIYCLSGVVNSSTNSNCSSSSSRTNCQMILGAATSSAGNYSITQYKYYIFNNNINSGDNKFFGCFNLSPSLITPEYVAIFNGGQTNNTNVNIDYEILKWNPDNNNGGGSSSCDYSEYESTIQTLSGNLSTCQNDLLTCQNSSSCDYSEYESTIQTLSGNLATCQGLYSTCDNNLSSCSNELNSCISNGGSSFCSGDIQWSSLYINNIQHIGASSIFVNIPEEISWSYTNENDEFDLDIEGYNVDTEYIDSIIRTQNYKPTSEDFTELVKMLAPYSKILIFCLFMFIIWAWIKKPFKSKKI